MREDSLSYKSCGGQPEKSAADDMQEDDEGKKKLGRQGTLVNLVEIHGKMSGDGDGWIDEGLEIQEDAHSPYPDEDELEVQATQEVSAMHAG